MAPDKSIDGASLVPYAKEPSLRSRRPLLFESFVQTDDVEQNGQAPTEAGDPGTRRGGPGARQAAERRRAQAAAPANPPAHASVVAPPKNYYGIRLGPYKYIEWPDGEKELYDINKDPYELNNIVRDRQLRADPRLPAPGTGTPRGMLRAAPARKSSEKLPLTREQQLKVKREKEKEQREREHEREKREREREQREEEKREREREHGKPHKP